MANARPNPSGRAKFAHVSRHGAARRGTGIRLRCCRSCCSAFDASVRSAAGTSRGSSGGQLGAKVATLPRRVEERVRAECMVELNSGEFYASAPDIALGTGLPPQRQALLDQLDRLRAAAFVYVIPAPATVKAP